MASTNIEWATDVLNPVTGCTEKSPGCAHCYARVMAKRLRAMGRPEYQDVVNDKGRWTGKLVTVPERLDIPLRQRKPRRYFVNSMSDLFHEKLDELFIFQALDMMVKADWHKFMILTKRADRMKRVVNAFCKMFLDGHPISNVMIGVSVENQKCADERIPHLLSTLASKRFLSCEPLLGMLDLHSIDHGEYEIDALRGLYGFHGRPQADCEKIDLVIAGGESGPRARPMHPDWVRTLRDQCVESDVKFFFKQWGAWMPIAAQYDDDDMSWKIMDHFGEHMVCIGKSGFKYSEDHGNKEYFCGFQPDPNDNPWFLTKVGKKKAGRDLDGRTWEEMP